MTEWVTIKIPAELAVEAERLAHERGYYSRNQYCCIAIKKQVEHDLVQELNRRGNK